VLEADRDGEKVFYTEAPALTVGGRPVPATALRRWDRPQPVKVLWFTVEGRVSYLALEPGDTLDRFHFEAFFRPEWGFGWTAAGSLDPANDDRLVAERRLPALPSGTQRYQARIEIFRRDVQRELVPRARFISPGPETLFGGAARGGGGGGAAGGGSRAGEPTAVVATLPGPAGPASAVFGLTEIEPPPGADDALRAELLRLTRQRLAFGRLELLATILEAAGRDVGELDWERIDLEGEVPWEEEVAAGDLVRVGDRVVVLYRDAAGAGRPGALDREDLCFDYEGGAAVRPLAAVFAPHGGEPGLVEWASLRRAAPPPGGAA
jgi:hypothetical protein